MSDYTIVAEDPGDIVVTFTSTADGVPHAIPLKSISVQKTVDVTPEFGTGWHGKYALTQGKVDYKGDFEIGTWWVSDAENPEKWMDLIKNELTWSGVQGLSREFMITIADTGYAYDRSLSTIGGNTAPTTVSGATIVTFKRCLLTGDSLSVGNVGSTASTKYSFTCMERDPA
jgi:hypothetical protein